MYSGDEGEYSVEPEALKTLLDIVIVVLTAKLLEELLAKYKQAPVLGDLLAGIILGPSVLGLVTADAHIKILASLGIFSLLFLAGAETDIGKMGEYGVASAVVGIGGVVSSFSLGFLTGLLFGYDIKGSLFIGAILVATSVGITVRTLMELGAYGSKEAYIIVGAAVFDDIYGLIVLALVYAAVLGKGGEELHTILLVGLGLMLLISMYLFTEKNTLRIGRIIRSFKTDNAYFVFTFIYGLGVAVSVGYLKLSPIVGAFFMGLALSRMPGIEAFKEKLGAFVSLISPLYFALIGLTLSIKEIAFTYEMLMYVVVFLIVGLISKIIGCGLTAKIFHLSWLESLIVGFGMMPRAEVASIIAFTGLALKVIDQSTLFATILLIYVSSIITPLVLKGLYSVKRGSPSKL